MSTRKIHLELLLGRLVRDPDGARVGRIFSVHAELEGGECIVREYALGAAALLDRLGISRKKPLCVPWDLLDVSDPERPRLRCRVDELGARVRG